MPRLGLVGFGLVSCGAIRMNEPRQPSNDDQLTQKLIDQVPTDQVLADEVQRTSVSPVKLPVKPRHSLHECLKKAVDNIVASDLESRTEDEWKELNGSKKSAVSVLLNKKIPMHMLIDCDIFFPSAFIGRTAEEWTERRFDGKSVLQRLCESEKGRKVLKPNCVSQLGTMKIDTTFLTLHECVDYGFLWPEAFMGRPADEWMTTDMSGKTVLQRLDETEKGQAALVQYGRRKHFKDAQLVEVHSLKIDDSESELAFLPNRGISTTGDIQSKESLESEEEDKELLQGSGVVDQEFKQTGDRPMFKSKQWFEDEGSRAPRTVSGLIQREFRGVVDNMPEQARHWLWGDFQIPCVFFMSKMQSAGTFASKVVEVVADASIQKRFMTKSGPIEVVFDWLLSPDRAWLINKESLFNDVELMIMATSLMAKLFRIHGELHDADKEQLFHQMQSWRLKAAAVGKDGYVHRALAALDSTTIFVQTMIDCLSKKPSLIPQFQGWLQTEEGRYLFETNLVPQFHIWLQSGQGRLVASESCMGSASRSKLRTELQLILSRRFSVCGETGSNKRKSVLFRVSSFSKLFEY